jgi:hypothetical protein
MVSKEHVDEAVTILDATFAETQNA